MRLDDVWATTSAAPPKLALLLPDLRGGGAERVSINLANEFVARGFSVDLIVMAATGELIPLLRPEVRMVDLGVNRMRHVLRPLTRYLREARPSSLLACMWPLTIIATAAHWVAGSRARLVVAEHTTWSIAERSDEWLHRLVVSSTMRCAFARAEGVVAVSKGAADDLSRFSRVPRGRITAIYNPIVGGAKAPEQSLPAKYSAATGQSLVLAVGTLKRIKDFATLLKAFAVLRRTGRQAVLLILGEGSERGSLEQMVTRLELCDHVFMPGFVPDPDIYLRRADLFVLSSAGEGFGNVIVEALEQGVPVVSTDCLSGPREILDNGRFGTLVPVGNPEALAQAMEDALSRPHDTAALKARASKFSVAKAADGYLDLLLPDWRQQTGQLLEVQQ